MSATDRQNRLLVAEDWKKVYQSFRNADFQSYDFENLRRTMVDYIRQNYPEDFNDYIESSEYLALLDVIAFLGQSVAFRVDLNARENFLELAERRDSVLRLARLISYNAKRHTPAQGLLKVVSIQTSQSVLDSNGRNLSGQVVTWNDSSNPNWYDQFIKIINAGMEPTQQFGNPSDKATIYGIPTEKYTLKTTSAGVPIYTFSKTIAGRVMNFEVTSTSFAGQNYIYEETPKAGNRLSCVYRNDGQGYGSAFSGFFLNFTQGTLSSSQFTITQPRSNEIVNVGTTNINNTDVWLYRLDKAGKETEVWTKVSDFEGNNIIYNSVNKGVRNIFSVTTRASDAISLNFSDGTFGNKPLGTFKTYYRSSNGISYTINPRDIRNVTVSVPYMSNFGKSETMTLTLSLMTTISNAEETESNAHIKANAPATYYTQNRMITGEDYNIAPLSTSQQVLKVKAINRSSSGISRYFDLVDPTGKYSSTNLFADDGVLYTEDYQVSDSFSYITKTDIEGVIYNTVNAILKKNELRNFYYSHYTNFPVLSTEDVTWVANVSTTGCIKKNNVIAEVGQYQTSKNELQYVKTGALVKFVSPTGKYFDTTSENKIKTIPTGSNISEIVGAVDTVWASVVTVDTAVAGASDTGITLNVMIPTSAIVRQIIPQFRSVLDSNVISTVVDLIFENKAFGLSYSVVTQSWQIVYESNINYLSSFVLSTQGDVSGTHQDASWLLLFTTNNENYVITSRETRYIFESDRQLRFYYNKNDNASRSVSNSIVRDKINILSINTKPLTTTPYTTDFSWDIVSEYIGLDGYIDNKKIVVSFSDIDNNGVVDNPELFNTLVQTSINQTAFIIQERYSISQGHDDYQYVSNSSQVVTVVSTDLDITDFTVGKYYYIISTGTVKQVLATGALAVTLDYKVYRGRDNIKFQYKHNANYNSRIDPGASNIIDVYILTKSYDTRFRQWVNGTLTYKPLPPSSDELYNTIAPSLNLIKSISDEIIYHPVNYKVLFGSDAPPELQATFKVTKTPGQVISDNDIKSQVISAINEFFSLENWDFGDTFFFTELSTYVTTKLSPNISNFVIVPTHSNINFGGLYEIKSENNEILINGASVNNVEIITGITATNIKSSNLTVNNNTINRQFITSSIYGSN